MKTVLSFKSLVALGLAFVAAATSACALDISSSAGRIEPSGVMATRSGSLNYFDELDVWSNVNVNFVIGDNFSYTLTADSAIIDQYLVGINGNHINVGTKTGISIRWKSQDPDVSITFTVPGYDAFNQLDIELSGASKIKIPQFSLNKLELECNGASKAEVEGTVIASLFEIDCSGASHATVDKVSAGELNCDCSGASTVVLNGEVVKLITDCSGASSVNAAEVKVKEFAKVECSGASKTSTGDLTDVLVEFEASGASSISYDGTPRITKMESSGASRIRK